MSAKYLVPAFAALLCLALSTGCSKQDTSAQTSSPATPPVAAAAPTNTISAGAPDTASAGPTKFRGKITAIDTTANTISITSKKGGSLTLSIDPSSKAGKALSQLAVGDKVTGSYTTDPSGKMIVTKLGKGKKHKKQDPEPAPAA
jgi:hypothetical protein